MNSKWSALLFCTFAAIVAAIYVVNPFRDSGYSPVGRLWGLRPMEVPSAGVEPTIQVGSNVWMSAWPYLRDDPAPGDIVVFRYPANRSILYCKRVVAVGVSTIELRNGTVQVDERVVKEPYTGHSHSDNPESQERALVRVPPHRYFVLGDNRSNSLDSGLYGSIQRPHIVGRMIE